MDGTPVRGQDKAGITRLNQAKDTQTFQTEFVRMIRADLPNTEVFFGLLDTDSKALQLPAWVRSHLERYCRERQATVLLASHNMHEVERLCDRVIIMKQGRIEDDDTPARLLTRYGRRTLEEVFLDVARGRDEAEAAQ